MADKRKKLHIIIAAAVFAFILTGLCPPESQAASTWVDVIDEPLPHDVSYPCLVRNYNNELEVVYSDAEGAKRGELCLESRYLMSIPVPEINGEYTSLTYGAGQSTRYFVYVDDDGRAIAKMDDYGDWTQLGDPVSAPEEGCVKYTSIGANQYSGSLDLYVAYVNEAENVIVKKLVHLGGDSYTWETVGEPITSESGPVEYTSIAVNIERHPIIAYSDGGIVKVKEYLTDAATPSWDNLADQVNDYGTCEYTSIAVDTNVEDDAPYVAYADDFGNLTVKKYSWGDWEDVVEPVKIDPGCTSIAFDGSGTLHIVYTVADYDYENIMQIKKLGTKPELTAADTNAAGDKIILEFNKEMNDPAGYRELFHVLVNGADNPVTAAALVSDDAKKIELTLTNAVEYGQTVTVDFGIDLTDTEGGHLDEVYNFSVNNHVPAAPPSISSQPQAAAVAAGGSTSFTVTASGTNLTYKWQVNTGSDFADISDNDMYSGSAADTLTITGATAAMSGYSYRVIVSGDLEPAVTSSAALLTVNDVPVINVINAAGVSGITAPAAGETPGGADSLIPGDTAYTVSSLTWQNEDGSPAALTAAGKFQAGRIYKAEIGLTAAAGNKFIALTPTVNTGTAGAGSIDTDAENNILTFSVSFAATADKSVDSINVKTQPSKLTYTAGESLDLTGLAISLIYNDGSSEDVASADFAEKGITSAPADGTELTVGEHNGKAVVINLDEHETSTDNLTVNDKVAPTYSIAAIDDQTMPDLNDGYSSGTQETRTITVTRTGSGDLTNLAVAISGGETGSFVITQPSATVLNEETPSTAFTIKAKDGLAAGVYTETVTVSADNMTDMTFTVSQTVNAAALSAPVIDATVAGDACVNISWNTVPGASGYKIYQSTTSGSYGEALATVGSSVCSYKSDGLTNGTPYYFAVKASFPEGDSVFSNEVSATPQASAHDAPTGVTARGGNEKVTLSWNPVTDASAYNIYQSTESGSYGAASATVSGSVYRHETIGLTNGVTYYFVVSSTNADGESPYSAEVSAMPQTVPDAPGNVSARAGNGQAAVSFTAPDDDGGTPVTGYVVVSNPGNIKASGTGTTIVVKGLQNGTAYTFTVQAENAAGISQPSAASDAVTPHRSPSGGKSNTSSKSDSGDPGVEILVNGKVETAATAETARLDDKTVTTITVDDKKVMEKLEKEGPESTVTIPVKNTADVVVGQLNGQTVKNMENREAVLEIRTENVTYTLPASQINIDNVSEQIGRQVDLEDITVNVSISVPPQDTVQIVEDTADHNNYQIVVKPVEFTITCTGNNKTVEVSKFNGYVERLIAIPEGIDPEKITTGIVLNNDGTFTHVPTTIIVMDGRYYARINSLTNSTYSVIWNPKTFKDVENHWAQEAVNDMGSRLVISGVGEDRFEPDRDITRAEFAAIVVRGLGLMRPGTGQDVFEDVTKACWYYDAVSIAYEYGIISGYGNDKFGPMDKITREQAMAMVARAMTTTGLSVAFREDEAETLFAGFSDSGRIADWARNSAAACIKTGIISGRKGKLIAPEENITRAEVAKMVRNLLQQSELI